MKPVCFAMLFAFLALLGAGCPHERKTLVEETLDPSYVTAKQRMREGNPDKAIVLFEKVIHKRPSAPESHLELGAIFIHHKKDPIRAIYHLQQYLEQKPDSREAPMVEDMILSAKRLYASQLPGNPFRNALDQADLLDTIDRLEKDNRRLATENNTLKGQLAILTATQNPQPAQSAQTTAPTAAPNTQPERVASQQPSSGSQPPRAAPTTRSYTVEKGDTLYRISMRFYGRPDRVQAIFEKNRSLLKDINDLKPGQVIQLPE